LMIVSGWLVDETDCSENHRAKGQAKCVLDSDVPWT
jgi:hypothetical protein